MPKFSPLFAPLFLRSLIAAIGCSISGSIVGTYILYRNLTNITGALSHSLLSGLGLGIFLNYKGYSAIEPGTWCLLSAFIGGGILALAQNKQKQSKDSITTVLWVTGSAIGLIFCAHTPTASLQLGKYLMGNLVWVSNTQLINLLILNILVLTITFFFHKRFVCVGVDEDFAKIRGISINTVHFVLVSTIALTVAILTLIFGSLLVMAFINLPVMCAVPFAKNINQCIFLALCISILGATSGLVVSVCTNIPPSASTSLILAALYVTSQLSIRK